MRVLIVEDEERIVSYLAKCLKDNGFTVDCALDGNTALEKGLAGNYDLITLDIMLPGMSGYRVCEELRRAGIDTPILMLTAKDGEYDEADALDIGADDFLRKPFSAVVLIARLRALLRRKSAAHGSTPLTLGGLVLDPSSKSITYEGEIVKLTPREFSLLEYLMYNAGAVLSKQQLLDHVWGPSYIGATNVVEVYIGYLRKKLAELPDAPRIATMHGTGYCLTVG